MGSGASKTEKEILPTSGSSQYEYDVTISADSADIPVELVETEKYFYLVLEVPGIAHVSQMDLQCDIAPNGYEVTFSADLTSAVEGPVLEMLKCTRRIGKTSWRCALRGIFGEQPECNLREGVIKMRFRKRLDRNQPIEVADF